jgi:hypothetical protein
VSIGWQLVKGNHLQRTRDINLGTPTPATITVAGTGQVLTYNQYPTVRPIAAFDRILQFESSANSEFNGLTAQVNKRFSHNFQFSGAYTWGHVIDDAPDATAVVPVTDDGKELYDPLNPRADRSSGLNDQRHRLVLSGIWQLKYADSLPTPVKAILGGWEISSIFTAQSGQPYSGLLNADLNRDGNSRSERTPGQERNSFRLPANYSLDPRFTKNIKITEQTKLQIFVEAFNILNHFNKYAVRTTQYAVSSNSAANNALATAPCGTNFGVGTQCLVAQTAAATAFGLPTSSAVVNLDGARIFQLGAKISF